MLHVCLASLNLLQRVTLESGAAFNTISQWPFRIYNRAPDRWLSTAFQCF